MSRQRDRMRSVLGLDDEDDAAPSPAPVVAAASGAARHMPAGSIKALETTLTRAEREADELRRVMEAGVAVVDLDPASIDAAPVADRLDDGAEAFDVLKESIAANGQEVPILVRPHPARPGRFQVAYGHRRLRAAADLGRMVRAVVRPLTDEQLVLAQGLENSARRDLTWIEQATFAMRLEERGHKQDVVARALTLDRTTVNKMIQTARAIPADIVRAIGRAPKVGRPRWEALAAAIATTDSETLRAVATAPEFSALDAAGRLSRLMDAAKETAAAPGPAPARAITMPDGARIARLSKGATADTLKIDDGGFADWLADRLVDLYLDFEATGRLPTDGDNPASANGGRAGGRKE